MSLNKTLLLITIMLLTGCAWADATAPVSDDSVGDVAEFESHWFVPANDDEQETNNFILAALAKGLKEPVEMGWFIPPNILITDKKIDDTWIYADGGQVLKAKLSKPLSSEDVERIRQQFGMLCSADSSYFQYSVETEAGPGAERVLYSGEAIPDAKSDFEKYELSPQKLDSALKALGGKQGFLHRYLGYKIADGEFVYSFNAFYDTKTKALRKSGIVLQGKDGKVLAKNLEQFDASQACKNCEIPTSDEALEKVYSPVDFIHTALLPYPLAVLKTETSEGKGLSLMTFDTKGAKSEVRAFEYLKGCEQPKNQ